MALILIVDDEYCVRQVLVRWLQGAGHQILEAESADAALEVMKKTATGYGNGSIRWSSWLFQHV